MTDPDPCIELTADAAILELAYETAQQLYADAQVLVANAVTPEEMQVANELSSTAMALIASIDAMIYANTQNLILNGCIPDPMMMSVSPDPEHGVVQAKAEKPAPRKRTAAEIERRLKALQRLVDLVRAGF